MLKLLRWLFSSQQQAPSSPSPLSEPRFTALCGHTAKQKDIVEAFRERVTTTLPFNSQGIFDYCHACLAKMAIQCAWCSKPIFIGDAVTLFHIAKTAFTRPPSAAVLYEETVREVCYVGCLRIHCIDTSFDRAGFWMPDSNGKGYVKLNESHIARAMYPVKTCSQAMSPGRNGQAH